MMRRSPLAVHRFTAGLTQEELAVRAHISREAVIALEQGKHRPRRLTARALADALDVPVSELFPIERESGP
jgi:DNA-binding XRE family transcriptional regulator